jgi:hypothetical protein
LANTLLTPTALTREALRVLHNNLAFARGVNRQYSKEFAVSGAKIGSSINIRKPNRYFVRTGAAINVQNTTEAYTSLALSTQWGVDISFSSAELTLSLDDFSKRILTPAMARIASKIDEAGLALYTDIYNIVGTFATTPGSASGGTGLLKYTVPGIYLNSGMVLDHSAAPRDDNRRVILGPAAMASSVDGLSGLYNPQGRVSEQYKKGLLGQALGFEFAMDQNVATHTNGTRAIASEITVQATWTSGSNLSLTGGSATIKKGDVLTVAGVYMVNPENGQSTGILQPFVVTADVTMSGTTSVGVSPTPKLASATVADGNINRVPTGSDAVVWFGATASVGPQNMAYHQDAFTLGTADLELPKGVDFGARENYDGISMRIVRAYDVNSDQFPCRIDVLGGWATLRPELACRITG